MRMRFTFKDDGVGLRRGAVLRRPAEIRRMRKAEKARRSSPRRALGPGLRPGRGRAWLDLRGLAALGLRVVGVQRAVAQPGHVADGRRAVPRLD